MFIKLLKQSLVAATVLAACLVAPVSAGEKRIVPLDVRSSEFHQGSYSGDPAVCKSADQLTDALGKEVAKRVRSQVDLATHEVLVFRWYNSGTDKFEIVNPKQSGEPWIFTLTTGNTKAHMADIRAYAVPRDVAWQYWKCNGGANATLDATRLAHSAPSPDAGLAAETRRVFQLESEADFVALYSTDGKLDIGIGRTDKERNLHHSIRFTLDELEGLFDDQKHKDLIVVTIAKHDWSDEELAVHVSRLRDYFIARAYKRIVIEQANGTGRGIHVEHPRPKPAQGGARPPASALEARSEVNQKPKPDSEGRPHLPPRD
jgi:hypothetical protein